MKRILIALLLSLACDLPAASTRRGEERLRELAVFPTIELEFGPRFVCRGGLWIVIANKDAQPQIRRARQSLTSDPENISQLLQLGSLLAETTETNAARECFTKAEQLARRKVEARPKNATALAQLGEALAGLEKFEEAESVFRKATSVSSNQWAGWYDLGRFLSRRSYAALLPPELRFQFDFLAPSIPQEVLDYRPPVESLLRAEEMSREALRCFDRAIELAPERPGLRTQRAGNRCFSDWKDCLIRHIRNQDSLDAATLRAAFFSEAAVPDFRKAAELDPKDYRDVAWAAVFEAVCVFVRDPGVKFETLPETTRQTMRQTMTRLENLAAGPDKTNAAGACEMLAMLNLMAMDIPAAKANSRRAVALDKTRERSWDILLLASAENSSDEEMVALCRSRLATRKSARNHLLLAKTLADQKKWSDAANEVFSARKLDTNNIVVHLMLAALVIRSGEGGTNALAGAAKLLKAADELLEKMPPGEEARTRWREHRLNSAIVLGLHGETAKARDWASNVSKYYPKDETAKQILDALE